jgi:hypothetical protein
VLLAKTLSMVKSEGQVRGVREVVNAAKLALVASGARRTKCALCNDKL